MIRVVDLVIYAAIATGGIYAIAATPGSVEKELGSDNLLIWAWGAMLVIGGVSGFLGRLTRRWMVETPATVLALFGVMIYVVLLARLALTSVTAAVAVFFTLAAAAILFRRWSELQIFASGGKGGKEALLAAARRKTVNFARHS